MHYSMAHTCIKVQDMESSINFYQKALHLREKRRIELEHITLVYLGDEEGSDYELELNCPRDVQNEQSFGSSVGHFAFCVDDYAASLDLHQRMLCVKLVSEANGMYFIEDPDGYTIEILPRGHFSRTKRGNFNAD